ncbi:hypothetical protein L0U95_32800 (plasmid) [Burkholderia cenocepacia]|nr:hypothetical protein [Burkholderia cenocepacia]UJH78534.1 hypothetical protein L0U95_32800 [Burkholderia cenocepacia]
MNRHAGRRWSGRAGHTIFSTTTTTNASVIVTNPCAQAGLRHPMKPHLII